MAQHPQPPQQPQGILSFLGCKISLVSKSEIRYEGTLYTIDSKQGTVALEKVRMLGTEGRRADRQVAPSQEIYEYIIFRASDIKDLHVCEPPPPPQPQPQVQVAPAVDPAVVSAVSQPYNPYAQPQPPPQQQQQQAYSPFYGGLPQQQPQHQQHPQLPPPSTVFAAPAPAPAPVVASAAAAAEVAPAAQAPAPARKPLEIVRKPAQQQQQQQQTAEQPEATTAAAATAPVQQPEQAQDAQQQQQPPMTRGWLGGRGRRMQGPGQQQQQQSAFAGPAVTRDQLDEFDFASSNSKFDREKLRQEVETTTGGNTPVPAYDRSRSFFDSLVPSPSRPQRERPMHIEAASETFGAGAVPVYNRRGGRGGGGRGGRRGQQFFAQPGMQQQQQRYNYHYQRPMQHQQRQQQQQSGPLLTPVAAPDPTQQPQQQ